MNDLSSNGLTSLSRQLPNQNVPYSITNTSLVSRPNISIQTLDIQWESIESSLHKKPKHSSKEDDFYANTNTNNNNNSFYNNNSSSNWNGNNSILSKEFDFKYIIHPIDHEFEDFVRERIEFLEKMKTKNEQQCNYPVSSGNNKNMNDNMNNMYEGNEFIDVNDNLIKNKNEIQLFKNTNNTNKNSNSNIHSKHKKTFLLNDDEMSNNNNTYNQTVDNVYIQKRSKFEKISKYKNILSLDEQHNQQLNKDEHIQSHQETIINQDGPVGNNKLRFKDVYDCLNSSSVGNNKCTGQHTELDKEEMDVFDEMFSGYFMSKPKMMLRNNNKRSKSSKEIKCLPKKEVRIDKSNNNNNKQKYHMGYSINDISNISEHNNKMIANRKMNFNVYNKLEDNKHLLNFLFKPKK